MAQDNQQMMLQAGMPVLHAAKSIKLPLAYDVERLQQDIARLKLQPFVHYDVLPLRSPAHLVDPALPFPNSVGDYADGSWTPWLNTSLMEACCPYIQEIITTLQQHVTVNLVRILRLAPHGRIDEHTDPTLGLQIERAMVRLTIPISVHDSTCFYLNQQLVPMQPGECWYMRLTDPHYVDNPSDQERINLTIDVVPNDWLYEVLLSQLD